MNRVSQLLRLGMVAASLYVLSGIFPISLTQFRTGQGCPYLGPVPACYIVTVSYGAMGLAAVIWRQRSGWLFAIGIAPVLLLALTGTMLEILGRPTCPRSDAGVPLCYMSLAAGTAMLAAYVLAWWAARKAL